MNRKSSCCTSADALVIRISRAVSLLAACLLVAGSGSVWAHSNPSTCTKTGPALLLTELRDLNSDGVGETPITGSKVDGETIYYQASLFISTATGQCAYQGGTICIDRPGASGCVDVTPIGGVPLLCDNDAICDPDGVAAVDSQQIPYVVNHNDFDTSGLCDNQVRAVAQYRNGTSHFGGDVFPVNADTPICNPVLFCGDGIVGNTDGETCDPPGAPGGANGNTCRANCTVCGDGVLNAGEECDDGNTNNNDSCRNTCVVPECGDGVIDPGETCDPPGAPGGVNGNTCRAACNVCGDGIVNGGEQCDDGNTNNNDNCRNNCLVPVCGDGIINAPETCDPPGAPGGVNGNTCRAACNVCGDGIVNGGEVCDDGNTNNTDLCSNTCELTARCGDGIVGNTPGETCDPPGSPGGANNNTCRQNCTVCGDGNLDSGEVCDDGNSNNTDACANNCTIPPRCGDSIVGNTPGETCDPPGSVPPGGDNECRANCTFCGDGNVDGGETCDDGNQVDGDGCNSSCVPEGEAICRTPGFWGTHAFANPEKKGSQNITQAVIDAGGGCLNVCGETITNTDKNSADSALEAICISIKGDPRLQLARHLTAAALNCIVSDGDPDCSGTNEYALAFSQCNAVCGSSSSTQSEVTECIGRIDCLNNGGIPLPNGQCQKGICAGNQQPCNGGGCSDGSACNPLPGNCHDRDLVNEDLGLDFAPPGPAGSSGRCNNATGNSCKVLQPGEANCATGDKSVNPEVCP